MIGSLGALLAAMRSHGAYLFYAKKLSPNDNSKNQVYLGGDFSALNIIPHGSIYTDDTNAAGSRRDRAKANLSWFWIDEAGRHKAPAAQLILYPKYPEVRLSGFLQGCPHAPSDVMAVRDPGRVLILGVTNDRDGSVLAYAAGQDDPIAREVLSRADGEGMGVFIELTVEDNAGGHDTRSLLLSRLTQVYQRHWIPSQKLGNDGVPYPYRAMNGGGYTLEAELGIRPNGRSEPDYMGWEVKQYGVKNFDRFSPKSPVTLMTPEPTGGMYRTDGAESFVRRFGYPDVRGRPDRLNFGGRYICSRSFHQRTGLKMVLEGFDTPSGKIADMNGGIALISRDGEIAAKWNFGGLMAHWNRKHAKAAYVPSLFRQPPPEYRYGPRILLCEKTDFSLFLGALSAGDVYYDPGIKLESTSGGKPCMKQRSQFRVHHRKLVGLYRTHTYETLTL